MPIVAVAHCENAVLDCSARQARSARIAPSSSPTSSSLTDDNACLLAPPQHGEGRDPGLDCSARQARCVQLLAPLAAMFAGEPPSSSNLTKRLSLANRLCSRRVWSASPADRRREHRGRGSRLRARRLRRRSQTIMRVCSLLLSTARGRDPASIAPLADARSVEWPAAARSG